MQEQSIANSEVVEAARSAAPEATKTVGQKLGVVVSKVAEVCAKAKQIKDGALIATEAGKHALPYLAQLLALLGGNGGGNRHS